MKEYKIEITETLSKIVEVYASSEEMAMRIVKDRYMDEELTLDYADFVGVEFNNADDDE
jgi:hypothetical protein